MSYWTVLQTARLSLSLPAYELSQLLPTSGQTEDGEMVGEGKKEFKVSLRNKNNVLAS